MPRVTVRTERNAQRTMQRNRSTFAQLPAQYPYGPTTPPHPHLDRWIVLIILQLHLQRIEMTSTTTTQPQEDQPSLQVATHVMCAHAFSTLLTQLKMSPHPSHLPTLPTTSAGVFVTWNICRNGRKTLRGCIGTLSPISLSTAISKYAILSALRDSRFSPIDANEISSLSVAVSVLSMFERASNVFDWQPGTHGIVLELNRSGERFSATYLPEVCVEQGWTKEECLTSLAAKAGWRSRVTDDLLNQAQLTRFQSSKIDMTWAEYEAVCNGDKLL